MPIALILGITGQDGAYLSRLLLQKDYTVIGTTRQNIAGPFPNLAALGVRDDIRLIQTDGGELAEAEKILNQHTPDEIYQLAAPASVAQSFDHPFTTFNELPKPVFTILEAMRRSASKARFCAAGSAECFGLMEGVATEETPFRPRSPYGVAKAFAYQATAAYRDLYGLHAGTAILFNHESPLRNEHFVTEKIASAARSAKRKEKQILKLGNLDARRDWGHAADYVEGMWRMLQQETPEDFVLATGRLSSVRDFAQEAFACAGIALTWTGTGLEEKGIDQATGQKLIEIDPAFFRLVDSAGLAGNPAKAERVLHWRRQYEFSALVADLVAGRTCARAAG